MTNERSDGDERRIRNRVGAEKWKIECARDTIEIGDERRSDEHGVRAVEGADAETRRDEALNE